MSDNSNLIKNNIMNQLNNISGGTITSTETRFPGEGIRLGDTETETERILINLDDDKTTYLIPIVFIILLIGILVCSILINHWLSKLEILYEIFIPSIEQKQDITKFKNNLALCEKIITALVVCIFTILLIIIPPDFIQNMFTFYKFFNLDSFIHFSSKLQHYVQPKPTHYYRELNGELKIDNSTKKFLEFDRFFSDNEDWHKNYNIWYEDILEKDWLTELKNNLPEEESDPEIKWLYLSYIFEDLFASDKTYASHLKELLHKPHLTLFLHNVFYKYKDNFDKLGNHYIKQFTNNSDYKQFINSIYKNIENTKVFENTDTKPMLAELLSSSNKNNFNYDDDEEMDIEQDDYISDEQSDGIINAIESYIKSSPTKIGEWYNDDNTETSLKEKVVTGIQNSFKKYVSSIFKITEYKLPFDTTKALLQININDLDNNLYVICVLYLLYGLSHTDNIILNNDIYYLLMTSILYYTTYKTKIVSSNTKYLLYFLLSARSIVYMFNYNSIKFINTSKNFDTNMINNLYGKSFDNFLPINIYNYLNEYFTTIEKTNTSLLDNQKKQSYIMSLLFLKSFTSYYDIIIVCIFLYIIYNNFIINIHLSEKLRDGYNNDNFVDIFIKKSDDTSNTIALPKNVNLYTTYKHEPINKSLFIKLDREFNIFKPDIDNYSFLIHFIVFSILLLSNKSISLPTLFSIMSNYMIIHVINFGSLQPIAMSVIYGISTIWYIVSFILYYSNNINISEYYLSHTEQSNKKFNINSSILLTTNLLLCTGYVFIYFYFENLPFSGGSNNKLFNNSNLLFYACILGVIYIVYNSINQIKNKKNIEKNIEKDKDIKGGSITTETVIRDTISAGKLFYTNFSISTAISILAIGFFTAKKSFTDNILINIRSELDNIEIAKLSQYIMVLIAIILFYPIKYALSSDGLKNAYCFMNLFLNIPKTNCSPKFSNEVSLVWLLVLIILTSISIYFIVSNKLDFEKPATVFTFIYIFSILFIIYTILQSFLYIFKDDIKDSESMKRQQEIKDFSNKIELKKAEIVNNPYSNKKIINYDYMMKEEFKDKFTDDLILLVKNQINSNYLIIPNETIKIKNIKSSIRTKSIIPSIELIYANNNNEPQAFNGMNNEKVVIFTTTIDLLLNQSSGYWNINGYKFLNNPDEQIKLREYKDKIKILEFDTLNGYYESNNSTSITIQTFANNIIICVFIRNIYSYHLIGRISKNENSNDLIISGKNTSELANFIFDLENNNYTLDFKNNKYNKIEVIQDELIRQFTTESNTYKKIKDLVDFKTDYKLISKYKLIENTLELESNPPPDNNRVDLLKLMISSTVLLINSYNKKQFDAVQEYHDKITSIEILYKLSKEINTIGTTNNQILTFKNKIYKEISSLNKSIYLNIQQLNPIIQTITQYNSNNTIPNNSIDNDISKLFIN